MTRWKLAKKAAMLTLGLIFIGYLAYYLFKHRLELMQAFHLSAGTLVVLACLVMVTMLSRVVQFQLMLSALGTPMSFWRAMHLTFTTQLLNYLPLSPGTVMQAAILKKEDSLKYASYASFYTARIVSILTSAGILGVIGLTWSAVPWQAATGPLWTLFISAAIIPTLALHIPKGWVRRDKSRLHKLIFDFLTGWEQLRSRRGIFGGMLLLSAITNLTIAARIWLCFGAMGRDADYIACLAFSATINFTTLLNITPGGLGLREMMVAAVASVTGFTFKDGMFASSLEHAVTIMMVIATCAASLLVIMGSKRRSNRASP